MFLKTYFLFHFSYASPKTNSELLEHSKLFWKQQFVPWNQTGITSRMMDEARKVYWGEKIDESKVVMVLWTIIEGKIYCEVKGNGWKHSAREAGSLYDWDLHLYQAVADPRFPRKI